MTTLQFYRRSLALPPLVLFLLALLPETNPDLVFFKGIGFFGLALGGIPYAVLCILLVRYSTKHNLRSFEKALVVAPLLLMPLIVVWTVVVIVLLDQMATRPDLGGLGGEAKVGLGFALFACVYELVVGYVFVGVVFLLKGVLRRTGVFPQTQV